MADSARQAMLDHAPVGARMTIGQESPEVWVRGDTGWQHGTTTLTSAELDEHIDDLLPTSTPDQSRG